MTGLLLAAVLPWMLIGFGCWFCYQLVRQNGRILLRLEALEQRLEVQDAEPPSPTPAAPSGLPLGAIAPEFELPDLTGTRHCLSDFRGRRMLLIFFNPKCGFCTAMAS
jgi:AhpC/TSA family protein